MVAGCQFKSFNLTTTKDPSICIIFQLAVVYFCEVGNDHKLYLSFRLVYSIVAGKQFLRVFSPPVRHRQPVSGLSKMPSVHKT